MDAAAASVQTGSTTAAAVFRPVKWGDGGYIRGKATEPRSHGATKGAKGSGGSEGAGEGCDGGRFAPREAVRRNTDVYLCAFPPADHPRAAEMTRPTRDPADRAHGVRHTSHGLLVPAGTLGGMARARRYPPHQMTSRGVSHDSACDELAERVRMLERWGWGGGGARQYGSITGEQVRMAARARARAIGRDYASDPDRRSRESIGLASAEAVLEAYRRGEWVPD